MPLADLYAELMQPGDLPDPFVEALRLRPPWHADAACTGLPGEWWFPPPGYSGKHERGRGADALAVCELCPVREPCLAYALEEGLEGIWGATTTGERKAMRKAAA